MKKIFLYIVFSFLIFYGCSSKNPPIQDVESAKVAFLKLKNEASEKYIKSDISQLENKIKIIEKYMEKKEYDKAHSEAVKVKYEADYLSEKIKNIKLENKIKKLKSEIDKIEDSFIRVENGDEI